MKKKMYIAIYSTITFTNIGQVKKQDSLLLYQALIAVCNVQ